MERFNYLFNQYVSKKATDLERNEFQDMLQADKFDERLKSLIDQYLLTAKFDNKNLQLGAGEEVLRAVFAAEQGSRISDKPLVKRLWPRVVVAASIAVVFFSAVFFYYTMQNSSNQTSHLANDIAPGKNGATLTLANGKKIFINDALAGNIAEQSGVKISKSKDGQIIYEISDDNSGKLEYNTLSTLPGEQTQVRLPDGSLVFLNAMSSLKYPTSFKNLEKRNVSLMGEGYFEIAKDKAHPFIVVTDKQEVEVLGTHFNINSYSNEPTTKTTLLEGRIKLTSHSATGGIYPEHRASYLILKPNQQATLTDGEINVKTVDAEDAAAWKNGQFIFEDETLENILKSVERWYDVEITYQNGVDKKEKYWGAVSRYDKVSKVLENLQLTKSVHFKVEGRRIVVMK